MRLDRFLGSLTVVNMPSTTDPIIGLNSSVLFVCEMSFVDSTTPKNRIYFPWVHLHFVMIKKVPHFGSLKC